jgi:hypothetical protein
MEQTTPRRDRDVDSADRRSVRPSSTALIIGVYMHSSYLFRIFGLCSAYLYDPPHIPAIVCTYPSLVLDLNTYFTPVFILYMYK